MAFTSLNEGVGIALSSINANKARAALTILGVAIGVMVVMVIGSMIAGINRGVEDIFNQLGPRTFFVFRHFQGGIQISDGSDERSPWRRKPPLNIAEGDRLRELSSLMLVVEDEGTGGPVEYRSRELESTSIRGRGVQWPLVGGGDIEPGRSFTNLEYHANAIHENCHGCHKKFNKKMGLKSKDKGYAPTKSKCKMCHPKKKKKKK